ncbi:unnamed protein product, partial [Didymodactylos carnosus]
TNCEDSTVTIPFHCRRLAPLVSLDPLLLNCKTIERGGKIEFPIKIKNDGHMNAQLELDTKENPMFIYSFNGKTILNLSTQYLTKATMIIEIKKNAPLEGFKVDVQLRLQSSQILMPIINGKISESNISELLNQTLSFIPNNSVKQVVYPIAKALKELNSDNHMNVIHELLEMLPEIELSHHMKLVLSDYSREYKSGEEIINLAQQLIPIDLFAPHEFGLGTIMNRGKLEPHQALKEIAAMLPENIQLGFQAGLQQLLESKDSQQQIIDNITDIYGKKTGTILETSFNALDSLKNNNKLQSLKHLSKLIVDKEQQHRIQTVIQTIDKMNELTSYQMKDVALTALKLASQLASPRISNMLQTVTDIHQKLIEHDEVAAIKDVLKLIPDAPKEIEKIATTLGQLIKQQSGTDPIKHAFNVAKIMADDRTLQILDVVENVLEKLEKADLRSTAHLIVQEFFSEHVKKIDLALSIAKSASKALSETNDPLHALDTLMNNTKELQIIVRTKDLATEHLLQHGLNLSMSLLPSEQAAKVKSAADLIESIRAGDRKQIVENVMIMATQFLPPQAVNVAHALSPLINKKLNNQSVSFDDFAGDLIGGDTKKIIDTAKPFVKSLMSDKSLTVEQYFDIAVNLANQLGVDQRFTDVVKTSYSTYKNIQKLAEAIPKFINAPTLAAKAAQFQSIASTVLSSVMELIPNLPEAVKQTIYVILAVVQLLKVTDPIGLIIAAVGLFLATLGLFRGLFGGKGSDNSGGKGSSGKTSSGGKAGKGGAGRLSGGSGSSADTSQNASQSGSTSGEPSFSQSGSGGSSSSGQSSSQSQTRDDNSIQSGGGSSSIMGQGTSSTRESSGQGQGTYAVSNRNGRAVSSTGTDNNNTTIQRKNTENRGVQQTQTEGESVSSQASGQSRNAQSTTGENQNRSNISDSPENKSAKNNYNQLESSVPSSISNVSRGAILNDSHRSLNDPSERQGSMESSNAAFSQLQPAHDTSFSADTASRNNIQQMKVSNAKKEGKNYNFFISLISMFGIFQARLRSRGAAFPSTSFNVLTFGKQVQLIKSYKQNYDRLFIYHLLNSFKIDGETTLLKQHSITVIGIGIGLECNGVCLAFNDWIIAQNPLLLCDALINWSNEQCDRETPNDALFYDDKIASLRGDDDQLYSSTDEVWTKEMKTHFDSITQNTKRAIEMSFSNSVHNTPLTVDICFVMDCTGSMGSWILAAKQHIKAIADGVQKDMKEKYDKDSILRMAFVAYRDYTDSNRYDSIDFHQIPNIGPVETKIASQQATGGGDLCEDVQGGLDKALKLNWTKGDRVAKILVWVGDCPGHTPFCHNGGPGWDSYLGGLPDVRLMTDIIRDIKDQNIFLLLSDFTQYVEIMLHNIETIYKNDKKESQVKRIKLNQTDTSSLLNEVKQQVNTIIASEFM